jgi:hypothetical protein
MEWVVVFVIILILATLLVLRRSGWSNGFTLSRDRSTTTSHFAREWRRMT